MGTTINGIVLGTGLAHGAVTSNVIAESNILPRHKGDGYVLEQHITGPITVATGGIGAVTEAKLADVLSVSIGSTGLASVEEGLLPFEDGTNPLQRDARLAFDPAFGTFASENVQISGAVTLGGVGDLRNTLSNLADGDAILDDAILTRHVADETIITRHIADDAVTTPAIPDGAVTEARLADVLSVSIGGTGLSNVKSGFVIYGNEPLKSTFNIVFDETDTVLTTVNYTASNMVHAHDDFVIGVTGNQRFIFFVDGNNNLVANSINGDGEENPYINFTYVVNLLSNISVYQP
jgi:hypothetical protein